MERKTKHRLLGILVVIGLVIIILPFFQGEKEKEIATNTALVNAPPFPDQPVQVASAPIEQNQTSVSEQQTNIPQANLDKNKSAISSDSVKDQPDDTISVIHPSVINTTEATSKENSVTGADEKLEVKEHALTDVKDKSNSEEKELIATNTSSIKTNSYRIIEGQKERTIIKNSTLASKKHSSTSKDHLAKSSAASGTLVLDNNGLMKLKSSAWVIQVGSYQNKANALRIVNHLRANGYRAFIQQVTTALGENTRVFIGPEYKRAAARALADKLHSELHIQGIVISYKPLTL